MRKKEIVVLDCGVEMRQDAMGVLFISNDPNREFCFGIKKEEIPEFIKYLYSYGLAVLEPIQTPHQLLKPELTPIQKAAQAGVSGAVLAGPADVAGKGRVIPASAVSVHQG